jgi:hypothetical protein
MRTNGVNSQRTRGAATATGLTVVPQIQQTGPDRDSVASMVRHAIGPVLDELSEAKKAIHAAQRLRQVAKRVGDEQVEEMIAAELRSLASAGADS